MASVNRQTATSLEAVTRAIEFRGPPWLPIKDYGPQSDVVDVACEPIKSGEAADDPQLDEWLCRWVRANPELTGDQGQCVERPLDDLAGIEDYAWPDGSDPRRTGKLRVQLEPAGEASWRDKYIRVCILHLLWERMWSLHGFADCMVDLMDDLPQMHDMADRIVEFDMELMRNLHRSCGNRVHGIGFSDDWGTQVNLQISVELWRSFFRPRYKKIFDLIHACGWHVWFHSCGRINSILPDMIELGVDVVNMKQPLSNGIEEIGRDFAGKICFETVVDVQKTLPKGDREEIADQAKALLQHWSTPAGGFILCDVADHETIGSRPETKQFVLDTFRKLDPYKKQSPA